jgi:hypothetical protein
MGRFLKIIAASFVLLCVLAIFVAPSLDLPDTAMRVGQAWAAILFAIVAMFLCAWLPALFFEIHQASSPILVFDPDRARSQLTC